MAFLLSVLPAFFLLYLVKFQILGIPFTLIEIVVYVLFLIFLVKERGFLEAVRSTKWIKFLFNYGVSIFLIVFGVGVGILLQNDTELFRQGLGILKGWILAPILYLFMFVSVIRKKENLYLALYSYIASSVFLSLLAIYQVISGDYITIDERASALFQSANYLALYIGPAILASFIIGFERFLSSAWKVRGIYGLTFLILGLGLLFSASYAGILAVIAGFGIYFIYKIRNLSWKKISALAVIAVLFIGIFAVTQRNTYKFQDFLNFEKQSSSSARLQIWKVAGHLISENPLFGVGAGAFQKRYEKEAAQILGVTPYDKTALHPHNIFMTFWLYSGIFGLIGFLWLSLVLIVKLILAIKKFDSGKRILIMIGLSMFSVILIHGFFDTPFWKNDLSMIFFMITGINITILKL